MGDFKVVPLTALLQWLWRQSGPSTKAVLRSLLCWLGWVVESAQFWATAPQDPLLDAPVPLANRRARRLDKHMLQAVGESMGSSRALNAPGRVTEILARFRRWRGKSRLGRSSAMSGLDMRLQRYQAAGQQALSPEASPMLGAAFDGTRMGQKDTFYTCIYSPSQGIGMWAPPQVCPKGGQGPLGENPFRNAENAHFGLREKR